jgi:mannan endo-1,4-beta-mannosidase
MAKPVPPSLQWMKAEANRARPVIEVIPDGSSLAPVTAGARDGWLRSLAMRIRQLNERVVVAFGPEANGTWYRWGSQPARFRAAWRHVWTVLNRYDASEITWMWQMSSHDLVTRYWPGARYVQWVGIDGYFRTPHNTFGHLFDRTLDAVNRVTADPVLLSETAVGPLTHREPADISRLFRSATARHLIAVVWFDATQNDPPVRQDWHLAPDSAPMAAFRKAVRGYLTPSG